MPSSPSDPASTNGGAPYAAAWEPFAVGGRTATLTLPQFEQVSQKVSSVAQFAVDRSTGIPADVFEAERAAAQASGYAAGYANGMAEARTVAAMKRVEQEAAVAAELEASIAARTTALDAIFDAADELEHQIGDVTRDIEQHIISAAWDIASAIVGQVLADDDTRSKAALARALQLAPVDTDVVVSVSERDFALLGGDLASGAPVRQQRGLRTVTIVADTSLADGDAIAKSDATTIDARLAQATQRVRQVLAP